MKVLKLHKTKVLLTAAVLAAVSVNTFAFTGGGATIDGGSQEAVAIGDNRTSITNGHGNAVAIGPSVTVDGEHNIAIGYAYESERDITPDGSYSRTSITGNHNVLIADGNSSINADHNIVIGENIKSTYNSFIGIGKDLTGSDRSTTNIGFGNKVSTYSSEVVGDANVIESSAGDGFSNAAFGGGNHIDGKAVTAIGEMNDVLGTASNAFGYHNHITGDYSTGVGSRNTITGNNSVVLGDNTTTTANNSVTLGANSTNDRDNTVSIGSEGNERQIIHVKAGDVSGTSTDAINGSQLYNYTKDLAKNDLSNITEDGQTVVKNLAKNSVKVVDGNYTTVTTGTDGDATAYAVNIVANGKVEQGNTGIVTGGTVYETTKDLANRDLSNLTQAGENKIRNVMSDDLDRLQGKLTKDIAQAAATASALAALHPTTYDPSNKLDFSVGYGHYDSKSAVALGAFYHPNENTLFNVGGTLSSGKKAINAGLTFKIGPTGQKKAKSVATDNANAERLNQLEAKVAHMAKLLEQLANQNKRLIQARKGFKDVPHDHWAAEAVETLHANDVVHGYPDGEFKGDKNMTRYEYAQMLYNNEKRS